MAVVYEQLVPVLFGTDALQAMSTKAKELNKKEHSSAATRAFVKPAAPMQWRLC